MFLIRHSYEYVHIYEFGNGPATSLIYNFRMFFGCCQTVITCHPTKSRRTTSNPMYRHPKTNVCWWHRLNILIIYYACIIWTYNKYMVLGWIQFSLVVECRYGFEINQKKMHRPCVRPTTFLLSFCRSLAAYIFWVRSLRVQVST